MFHRKATFSLIELLVVIAILSILAALLLPALNRAKAAAYRVTCVSSLKQIGVGFVYYEDDFRAVPPSSQGGGYDNWPNPWRCWSRTVAKQGYLPYNSRQVDWGVGGELFFCPSKDYIPMADRRNNGYKPDYGMNYYLFGNHKYEPAGKWRSLREINSPASYYFMAEAKAYLKSDGRYGQRTVVRPLLYGGSGDYYQTDAHINMTNVMFGDMHVESLPGKEPFTIHTGNALPWANK